MSYSDTEWNLSQTQPSSNKSSQELLTGVNGSQIRHGENRLALMERKNKLDTERPGAESAKSHVKRVLKKIKDGVPMSESGSGYGESRAGGSPKAAKGPKTKPNHAVIAKRMTEDDWQILTEGDQADFVRPGENPSDAQEPPAAKPQNEGKLMSYTQAAGVVVNRLENRVEQNKIAKRIRLALPPKAPAQHATASEYPFGGDQSQANQSISKHFPAEQMPDQSHHWMSDAQMEDHSQSIAAGSVDI